LYSVGAVYDRTVHRIEIAHKKVHQVIVISEKYGLLGNRLFVFAHFIASAAEHGFKVCNPSFEEYAEFFQATSKDLLCRYPARRSILTSKPFRRRLYWYVLDFANYLERKKRNNRLWTVLRLNGDYERCDLGSSEFLSLAKSRMFVMARGWQFRDEMNFARHADVIRHFFLPIPEITSNVDALIMKARADCDVLVGVHIRHGDYAQFLDGKYFYEAAEYTRLMEKIEKLFAGKRVRFLVCSNAPQNDSDFTNLSHNFGTGHPIEDMYAFARCDFLCGPPSTFTMWASFYGSVPLYFVESPSRDVTLEDFVNR
jgi:hypothetical protein